MLEDGPPGPWRKIMASRDRIIHALDQYLSGSKFKDYAPVGLQVEGAAEVKKIVTGVSLGMALLRGAVKAGAQMVLVHHGMFWKNQSRVLKGPQKNRVAFLLENDLSLVAYHLPLDAHPVVGNNARIIKLLGARKTGGFGDYDGMTIGFTGKFERGATLEAIQNKLKPLTPKKPICFPGRPSKVKRFAGVSGGAGTLFEQAGAAGVDLYITGEPWEPAKALVQETGIGYLALGHYNSEKPGIMALGEWVKRRFKIPVEFLDIPNPV